MKRDVDCFIPGQTSWIPCTKFKAKFSDDLSHICDLECDVDIIGAKQPHNKFVIDISPQGKKIISGVKGCPLNQCWI